MTTQVDGEWIAAPSDPHKYVINGGILLREITNNRWRASSHRVAVTSRKRRFSIPVFGDPDHRNIVQPLKGCHACNAEPFKHPRITVQELLDPIFEAVRTENQLVHDSVGTKV
uniref:Isopenicillin N synthase-like Fe(2+) 2OG dioxygenase domain-containing protein n=1 Tax=Lotharella globosa TaxID=91324 RepID=A0A7S4DY27_9EUKA